MLVILIVLAVAFTVFFIWQNNDIVTTEIRVVDADIPQVFEGFRILQISDLQSKSFGCTQQRVLELSAECAPDIIVITGDLIDGHSKNIEAALHFAEGTAHIAPVYYVSGNHEWLSGRYDELCERLEEAGITVLDNSHRTLEKEGETIDLLGLKDPTFDGDEAFGEELKRLEKETSGFRVLLSHHPEYIDAYVENGMDLVLSGHAHGGQIRLPFIGGLFAPGQGWFPKYTSGLYEVENTSLVVSRGLGNSVFPLRVFNRPELVVVTLEPAR